MRSDLYTESGTLRGFHDGNFLYDLHGRFVGQLRGSQVYCMAGHYVGELQNGVIHDNRANRKVTLGRGHQRKSCPYKRKSPKVG